MRDSSLFIVRNMKRTVLSRQAKASSLVISEKKISSNDSSNRSKTGDKKSKLSFENLPVKHVDSKSENGKISKPKKLRASVDLEMMKEELKQLEDPCVTEEEKKISSDKLPYSFFDVPCVDLAKSLLGKILVRRLENGTTLKGRIVETEAYLGEIDRASQTYEGKVTPRNLPMYMSPGTIYVYLTYGMYHCFNISSGGRGCAVLLRALEPLVGIEEMRSNRVSRLKNRRESQSVKKPLAKHDLCNGPSKLCIALEIDRKHCKYSICSYRSMWIESDDFQDLKIVESGRIGIESAGAEWANKPLRFYVHGNTSVSKRDKRAESECIDNN